MLSNLLWDVPIGLGAALAKAAPQSFLVGQVWPLLGALAPESRDSGDGGLRDAGDWDRR